MNWAWEVIQSVFVLVLMYATYRGFDADANRIYSIKDEAGNQDDRLCHLERRVGELEELVGRLHGPGS